MKKLVKLSLITAALIWLGGCGSSTDAPIVKQQSDDTLALTADKPAVQTPVSEGVVEGTGRVVAVEVEPPEDTQTTDDTNDPVSVEQGKFLRGTSPVIKSLFFPANNGLTGTELYRYDLVSKSYTYTDIRAGALGSNPQFLTEVNGKIYFSANDGINGRELWVYDGTTNTATIRNLNVTLGAGSNPRYMTELDGVLYFSADDNTGEGRELYYYDIATNQHGYVRNHLLATLRPGPAGSDPRDLKVQDGVLYFSATEGPAFGRELYKYDPVANADSGPVRVADINPGAGGSNPRFMASIGSKVYFSANDGVTGREMWVYDSVTNTSKQIRDINPGGAGSNPSFLTEVNGVIFFAATDGTITVGRELWKYDTNIDNVAPVANINLVFGSNPSYIQLMDGNLYFAGWGRLVGEQGMELWKYNIASAKASLVDDIAVGLFRSSAPFWITEANGMLYFGAENSPLNGRELWKSDGENQSIMINNFNPGAGHFFPNPGANPNMGMIKTTW